MKRPILALALVAALSACGGGGDGGGAGTPAQASPQGFWAGDDFELLVTAGGELWGVELVGSGLVLYNGTLSASGNNFAAQGFAYLGPDRAGLTASGTFTERGTLSGTAAGVGNSAFTTIYDSGYDATPPPLTALAGSYSLSTGGSVAADGTGALTGTDGGCSFTGTIAPDASGKNFYRLAVNFGPSPCVAANQPAAGVLVTNATATTAVGGIVAGQFGQAVALTRN